MLIKKKLFNKLCIYIYSFFFKYLFKDIKFLFLQLLKNKDLILEDNVNIFLPKKIKKFSVVRSPTMSKLSKEQFEFRFFKGYLVFNFSQDLTFFIFKNKLLDITIKNSYLKYKYISNYNYLN
jgi:hypothetical protein